MPRSAEQILEEIVRSGAAESLVEDAFSALEKQDAGFAECIRIWRERKTVRTSIAVADGEETRSLALHVMVEDGDIRLLRNVVSRARRRDYQLGAGLVSGPDGHERRAYVASLGVGSLALTTVGDGILIAARKQGVVVSPVRQDDPAPTLAAMQADEGFRAAIIEGQPCIVGALASVTPAEIRAVRKGVVRLGLREVSPTLFILGMMAPGLTDGWVDMPFSLLIERPKTRRLVPPDAYGVISFMLQLADWPSLVIRAVRPLRPTRAWSAHFLELLERQQDSGSSYTRDDYEREVNQAWERWPSPDRIFASNADICFCKPE